MSTQHTARQCVSCGTDVTGGNAARFSCPECGNQIARCETCRQQSTLYECAECGFRGP